MKVSLIIALAAFTVPACTLQSQESFDTQPYDVDVAVPRNYQAVYADVVKGAQKCWGATPYFGTMPQSDQLQTDLYPDLGYGEVYNYASGTVFMPRVLVRIDKAGETARVRIKTGMTAGKETTYRRPALKWASGDTSCGV